jgi:hypothetical protein
MSHFTFSEGIVLLNVVKLHVFMFLALRCDVRYDFRVKKMFGSSVLPFAMYGINAGDSS